MRNAGEQGHGQLRALPGLPSVAALAFTAVVCAIWLMHPFGELDFVLSDGAGVVLACVALVGILVHRPAQRWPWLLLSAVIALDVLGDLSWDLTEALGHAPGYTSMLSTLLYLASYPAAVVALVCWLRGATRRDLTFLVDATMYATAAWVAIWIVVVHPSLGASAITVWDWIPTVLYPPFDLIVLAALWKIGQREMRYVRSWQLLFLGFAAMLVADVLYAVLHMPDAGSSGNDLLSVLYVVAYGLVAAAAVHPSMRFVQAEPGRLLRPPSDRGRTLGLGAAGITPFVLLACWPNEVAQEPLVVAAAGFVLVMGGFTCAFAVVRRHRKAERTLAWQAAHDSLTGLFNRAALVEELAATARWAQRTNSHWVLLFCDLDQFKVINDSLGHTVGDGLLVAVADRLRAVFGDDDHLARFGGDEFVVLQRQTTDAADAESPSRRVLGVFSEPFAIAGNQLHVSASVGVVTDEQSTSINPETFLRDADLAMYAAKEEGRGRVESFQPTMRQRIRDRLSTEVALRNALVDDGLVLAYQPIVSIADGVQIGSEALLRWDRRGDGDLVMPEAFVPLAEDVGLIVDIGAWVLRRAARHVASARLVDPDARVSVNVSARELRDPDMARHAHEILLTENVPPDAIVLEITESALLEPTATVRANFHELHDAGFRFAIDDFGTGYSSLAHLRRLEVDMIKIDRIFIDGLDDGPDDVALVQAIVHMAHSLGITVTAEGVERPGQLEILRTLGCDHAQGYLLGRPLVPGVTSEGEPAARARPSR
jgi:diguanylate cyclase (GGDEF)-like protein